MRETEKADEEQQLKKTNEKGSPALTPRPLGAQSLCGSAGATLVPPLEVAGPATRSVFGGQEAGIVLSGHNFNGDVGKFCGRDGVLCRYNGSVTKGQSEAQTT